MKPNLEALRAEIPTAVESRGMANFFGRSRHYEGPVMEWNVTRAPDYQEFLQVAQSLGAKVIVFHSEEFAEALVEAALEDLEEIEMPLEERREFEAKLREFRSYHGFTNRVELSFIHDGTMYSFDLSTDWFDEFEQLSTELEAFLEETDENDEPSIGGYFSRN